MTYASVTRDSIRKNAWKNLRTLLLAGSIGVSTRVYGSYPLGDVVLPLVVVENGAKGADDTAINAEPLEVPITFMVSVYSKNAEGLDGIADLIDKAVRGGRTTLKTYGLDLPLNPVEDLGGTGPFDDANGNRLHSKQLSVTLLY